MAKRRWKKEPGIQFTGPGVGLTVASATHPSWPEGTIVLGPLTKDQMGRPYDRVGESFGDWQGRRFAAGYLDKVIMGITPEQFREQFRSGHHRIVGAGLARSKTIYTRLQAETAKIVLAPTGRRRRDPLGGA